MNVFPIDFNDFISCLKSGLSSGHVICNSTDDWFIYSNTTNKNKTTYESQNKIEKRTSCNNGKSLKRCFTVKASFRKIISIIFSHQTRSAKWQKFQAIIRLANFFMNQSWSHTNPKFIYSNSIFPREKKMTKFVKKYNKPKQ